MSVELAPDFNSGVSNPSNAMYMQPLGTPTAYGAVVSTREHDVAIDDVIDSVLATEDQPVIAQQLQQLSQQPQPYNQARHEDTTMPAAPQHYSMTIPPETMVSQLPPPPSPNEPVFSLPPQESCCSAINCFAPFYSMWEPAHGPSDVPASTELLERLASVKARDVADICDHFTADDLDPVLCVVAQRLRGLPYVEGVSAPFVRMHVVDARTGLFLPVPSTGLQAMHIPAATASGQPLGMAGTGYDGAAVTSSGGVARASSRTSGKCVLSKLPSDNTALSYHGTTGSTYAGSSLTATTTRMVDSVARRQRVVTGGQEPDWSVLEAASHVRTSISDPDAQARMGIRHAGHAGVLCVPELPLGFALQQEAMLLLEVLDLPAHVPEHQVPYIGAHGVGRRLGWAYLKLAKAVNMDALRANSGKSADNPDTLCEGKYLYNIGRVRLQLYPYELPLAGNSDAPGAWWEYSRIRSRGYNFPKSNSWLEVFVGGVSTRAVRNVQHGVDLAGLSDAEAQLLLSLRAAERDAHLREQLRLRERKRAALLFHTAQYLAWRRCDLSVVPAVRNKSSPVFSGIRGCSALAFSPNGRLLAVAGGERSAHVVRIYEYAPLHVLAPGASQATLDSVSAGGGVSNGCVGNYSARAGCRLHHEWRLLCAVTAHDDYIYKLSFSADGSLLASCSSDGFVRLWNIEQDALHAPTLMLAANPLLDMPPAVLQRQMAARARVTALEQCSRALWHPCHVYSCAFLEADAGVLKGSGGLSVLGAAPDDFSQRGDDGEGGEKKEDFPGGEKNPEGTEKPDEASVFASLGVKSKNVDLLLLTAGSDGRVRVWSCATGEVLVELAADNLDDNPRRRLEMALGGVGLAGMGLGDLMGALSLNAISHPNGTGAGASMDARGGARRSSLSTCVNDVVIAADQRSFYTCDSTGTVSIWTDQYPRGTFGLAAGELRVAATGQPLSSVGALEVVKDAWRGRFRCMKTIATGRGLTTLALSETRQCLLVRTRNDSVLRVCLARMSVDREYTGIPTGKSFGSLALSPCERYLACSGDKGRVAVVDLGKHVVLGGIPVSENAGLAQIDPQLAVRATSTHPALPVRAVAWCPTMHVLAAGVFGADIPVCVLEAAHTPSYKVYNQYCRAGVRGLDAYVRMRTDGVFDRAMSPYNVDAEEGELGGGDAPTRPARRTSLPALTFAPGADSVGGGGPTPKDYAPKTSVTIREVSKEDDILHLTYDEDAVARERAIARVNRRLQLKYGIDSDGQRISKEAPVKPQESNSDTGDVNKNK